MDSNLHLQLMKLTLFWLLSYGSRSPFIQFLITPQALRAERHAEKPCG